MPNIAQDLIKLSENDLRKKILVPLLKALNSPRVEDWHGARENGIDIYFSHKNLFGDIKHCCFFIKKGDIKKSGTNDIRKMQAPIEEAVCRVHIDPNDFRSQMFIEEFYVVCSGSVNQEAKDYLNEMFARRAMPKLRIIDLNRMVSIVETVINKFNLTTSTKYSFRVATFKNFCNLTISNGVMIRSDLEETPEGKEI